MNPLSRLRERARVRVAVFAFFLPILYVSPYLFAAGTTAGETLLQSVSARAQAMGEATTSIPANEGSVLTYHTNPAALGFSKTSETAFTFKRGVADDNFALITFGSPTKIGSVAATVLYYAVGNIDLITAAGVTKSVKAQRDLGAVLTYSNSFWNHFSWGINGKFLRSELIESFTANAFAADAGLQLKAENVVLGFAVLNGGTPIKYNKTSDPLPLTFRSGLSYRKIFSKDYRAVAAFDLVKQQGNNPTANLGMEYTINGSALPSRSEIALRAGYKTGQDNGKISFGLGLNVNSIRVDYALELMGSTGSSHFFTLGLLLGG